MELKLSGKVALVSGSTAGIGLAIATVEPKKMQLSSLTDGLKSG